MISYEDLCQALDRFNGRKRNEAEMAALEHEATEAPAPAEEWDATAEAAEAADYTEDADPMASSFSEFDTSDEAEEEQPLAAASFVDQPPENTNEIDVDDIMIDDKSSGENV